MKKLFKSIKGSLLILVLFCIFLWLIRISITKSLFFGFLIWNLFLAIIPYCISTIVKDKMQQSSKLKLVLTLLIWLLFLPNAPYIITDFIHLHHIKANIIWLDIFILFAFSSTGLLFAILSLTDVYNIIKKRWNLQNAKYFLISATFLCGFGIYLGRFLRFNSWDVLTSPLTIVKKSFLSINDPKTWFITISFGSFLYLLFLFFNNVENNLLKKQKH
ncbi:DUF1361 domain-containing protein [Polaribacter sp. Hel_I_88]|uniref:DUF1361 domain-containing protein n=1 Tax=Polaribacter sp. Hel_I_88 TaxID=1250006 RepID=UPI00068D10EE|nr:DUF1361 domain-containing protein [Polaribacter sp. Hel_I_88]